MIVTLTVNGEAHVVNVAGHESLLWLLRESLDLPGAKDACEQGECGACTVLFDGDAVCSCLVMAADAEGSEVTTVEGLGTANELHPVQQAFVDHGAVQCGFCTPGLIVSTAAMLRDHPELSADEVREGLSGNLCRCTGYGAIERAIEAVIGGDVA